MSMDVEFWVTFLLLTISVLAFMRLSEHYIKARKDKTRLILDKTSLQMQLKLQELDIEHLRNPTYSPRKIFLKMCPEQAHLVIAVKIEPETWIELSVHMDPDEAMELARAIEEGVSRKLDHPIVLLEKDLIPSN